jgi:hypothetical protein
VEGSYTGFSGQLRLASTVGSKVSWSLEFEVNWTAAGA